MKRVEQHMTEEQARSQIHQSKVLSRIVAGVTSILLVVFFVLTMSNMTVVQAQVETLKNDPYPVSVAAGRVETLLVQLRTIAQVSSYAQLPEAATQMRESYQMANSELQDRIHFITQSDFIEYDDTHALEEGYSVLVERQNTLVDMCEKNYSRDEIRDYVNTQINPLISGLLSLDTAILGKSTTVVDEIYVSINNATSQVIFVSWLILIAVVLCMVVLLAILARKNHREDILRASLGEALQSAQAANQAKSTFLSSMSHDIRTPMNAIVGFTSIARNNMDDPDRVASALDRIDTSSKHLLSLINDVLDMSEIESGKTSLNEAPFSVSELIGDFLTIVHPQAAGKEIDFDVEIDDVKHEMLIGDTMRLNQVLLNLTSNAIKYTPRGGKVKVSFEETSGESNEYHYYKLVVSDTGIGMSPEFLDSIFDPFSREMNDTTSRTEGAGLGMSITKNVVDMMGGTIEVESELGAGTTFTVVLPLKVAEAAPPSAVAVSLPGSHEGVEVPEIASEDEDETKLSGRVLLVEDDALNREIAIELIKPFGVELDVACDGLEAVETIEGAQPGYYDLVFMDCQMPRMGGMEATEQIVAWEKAEGVPHTPIVAMTANAFNEDRVRAMEAGMDGFMTKPINMAELKRNLEQYLAD